MRNGYHVSKSQLFFENGIDHYEYFRFNWTASTRHGVEMRHNLPDCFDIHPSDSPLFKPCQIHVYYNPIGRMKNIQEPLFIKFTDFHAPMDAFNPCTVHVVVNDGRNPPNWESQIFGTFIRSNRRPQVTSQQKRLCSSQREPPECKICYQPYSDDVVETIPRILTGCGHTICNSCAVNISDSDYQKKIYCPVCRKITNDRPADLPKNFAIIDMLWEIAEEEVAPTEPQIKTSIYCETPDNPCFENPEHESTLHCTTCKEDFCEKCFEAIHTPKVLSKHESIPVDQKSFKYELCALHPENLAEFMCRCVKCKETTKLCCRECLQNTSHKTHTAYVYDVKLVTEQAQRTLNTLLQKLELSEATTSRLLDTAKECASSYEKSSMPYQSSVRTISNHFDQRKREALADLDNFICESKAKFDSQKKNITTDLREILATKRKIETALKKKNELCDSRNLIEEGDAMCKMNFGEGVEFTKLEIPSLDGFIKRTERPINDADKTGKLSPILRFVFNSK